LIQFFFLKNQFDTFIKIDTKSTEISLYKEKFQMNFK